MEYHQDWLMRQIQSILAFLIRLATGEREDDSILLLEERGDGDLHARLHGMVLRGNICQAENLLYEAADGQDMGAFFEGLRFYGEINQLTDARLEECDFSREEILEGIRALCGRYGISEDVLPLL